MGGYLRFRRAKGLGLGGAFPNWLQFVAEQSKSAERLGLLKFGGGALQLQSMQRRSSRRRPQHGRFPSRRSTTLGQFPNMRLIRS
jgi:hypothetical protein